MKFDPKEPVSIHNEWPRSKYPIPHGAHVWAARHGTIYPGKIMWYYPSRELDASCVTTPGHPWFQIIGPGLSESGENIAVEHVRRRTKAGRRELEAVLVREYAAFANRLSEQALKVSVELLRQRREWCRKWKIKEFPDQA